jgi:hypothetical protein
MTGYPQNAGFWPDSAAVRTRGITTRPHQPGMRTPDPAD